MQILLEKALALKDISMILRYFAGRPNWADMDAEFSKTAISEKMLSIQQECTTAELSKAFSKTERRTGCIYYLCQIRERSRKLHLSMQIMQVEVFVRKTEPHARDYWEISCSIKRWFDLEEEVPESEIDGQPLLKCGIQIRQDCGMQTDRSWQRNNQVIYDHLEILIKSEMVSTEILLIWLWKSSKSEYIQ